MPLAESRIWNQSPTVNFFYFFQLFSIFHKKKTKKKTYRRRKRTERLRPVWLGARVHEDRVVHAACNKMASILVQREGRHAVRP